jgi:hypothetical protein
MLSQNNKEKIVLKKIESDEKIRKMFINALINRKNLEIEIIKNKELMDTGIFTDLDKMTKLINLRSNASAKKVIEVYKKRKDFMVFMVGSYNIYKKIEKLKSHAKWIKSIEALRKYVSKIFST